MIKYILFIYILVLTSACSDNNRIVKNPITGEERTPGIFSRDSEKGVTLSDILRPNDNESTSVNVNGFLWRATLNVLSIAPLISTDALGGTIITDWYTNKNIENKRIKITAYISTSELRSDGIEVKVHVQKFKDNFWSETFVDEELGYQIEDNILNEARNLRVNSLK
tara:strand:+ start:9 stop:509 length:501 start_codon:yes stop_codon:yes gene_type:complete